MYSGRPPVGVLYAAGMPTVKPRTYDPVKVRAALTGQLDAIAAAVRELDDERLARPTRLGEWRGKARQWEMKNPALDRV